MVSIILYPQLWMFYVGCMVTLVDKKLLENYKFFVDSNAYNFSMGFLICRMISHLLLVPSIYLSIFTFIPPTMTKTVFLFGDQGLSSIVGNYSSIFSLFYLFLFWSNRLYLRTVLESGYFWSIGDETRLLCMVGK